MNLSGPPQKFAINYAHLEYLLNDIRGFKNRRQSMFFGWVGNVEVLSVGMLVELVVISFVEKKVVIK
jgi:hypothetical protein